MVVTAEHDLSLFVDTPRKKGSKEKRFRPIFRKADVEVSQAGKHPRGCFSFCSVDREII